MRTPLRNCFLFTNKARVHEGRHSFKGSSVLNKSAKAKAKYLASTGVLAHGATWYQLIYKFAQHRYGTIGENIADGQNTSEEVVRQWMHSPDHRANILNPQFTHMGVGFARRGDCEFWVQHFGGR